MNHPLEFHSLANLFPLVDGDEFDALVQDISANGLQEPVVLFEGQILDGRNRYRACETAGVSCQYRIYDGTDPAACVVSLNLYRRHLSESQRAMVAAKLANMSVGDNQHAPIGATSQEQAAELLNVGRRSVQRATEVREGVPELQAAVEQGRVSVSAAADVATLLESEQLVVVARGRKEILQRAKEIRASKPVRGTFGTGENEWYTPQAYLDMARQVLGGIDLDPASSEMANELVGAAKIFTEADNGLAHEWHGRVWLNPPYAQPAIAQFADKMVHEWASGHIEAAIVLTHNYTDTAWFHTLAPAASAICFLRGRIRFLLLGKEQGTPTQGQAFYYFGPRLDTFAKVFSKAGFVTGDRAP